MKKWCRKAFFIGVALMGDAHSMEKGVEENKNQRTKDILACEALFKKLSKAEQENSGDYQELATTFYKLYGDAREAMWHMLLNKKYRALQQVQSEWNISDQNLVCLTALFSREIKEGSVVTFRLESKPEKLEYFHNEVYNPLFFESILKKYLFYSPTDDITLHFEEARNELAMVKNTANYAGIKFGALSYKPIINLSENFFTQSRAIQEFTWAHEIAHMVFNHCFLDYFFAQYCAVSIIVKKYGQEPSFTFNEWLEGAIPADMNFILKQYVEEVQRQATSIKESNSFLSWARIMEYEADFLFAILFPERATLFEQALKEWKEYYKNYDAQLKKSKKKSTHPSYKKRWRWMHAFVKLLEADARIKK